MEWDWSEAGVREAVRAYAAGKPRRPAIEVSSVRVERGWLAEGSVERLLEKRDQRLEHRPGKVDLTKHGLYTGEIEDHPMPPAEFSPGFAVTLRLLRENSDRIEGCSCSNGKVPCPRCEGRGDLTCAKRVGCGDCADSTPCTECDGDEDRARRVRKDRRRNPPPATRGPREHPERVTCVGCGTAGAACPRCRGRKSLPCPRCKGTGVRPCQDCGSSGSVRHDVCDGKGFFTQWTEGLITRTVAQRSTGLVCDIPDLAPGRVAGGRWEEFPLGPLRARDRAEHPDGDGVKAALASLPDELPSGFMGSLRRLLAPDPHELACRGRVRRIPVARATSVLDTRHVYFAYPRPGGKVEVYDRPTAGFWLMIAGIVLAAVLLAVLVALLV